MRNPSAGRDLQSLELRLVGEGCPTPVTVTVRSGVPREREGGGVFGARLSSRAASHRRFFLQADTRMPPRREVFFARRAAPTKGVLCESIDNLPSYETARSRADFGSLA